MFTRNCYTTLVHSGPEQYFIPLKEYLYRITAGKSFTLFAGTNKIELVLTQ